MSASSSFGIVIIFFIVFTTIPLIPSQSLSSYLWPSSNISTVWTNNNNNNNKSFQFGDAYNSQVRIILLHNYSYSYSHPSFACGFYCNGGCDGCVFAVFIILIDADALTDPFYNNYIDSPTVVWSANRARLVKENATVELTSDGNLVLREVDGSVVWSTGTSGKSVVSMNITSSGNLVLFDQRNRAVWQSFDHPTDVLVLGQTLKEEQNLTSNSSTTSLTQGMENMSGN